MQGFDDINLGNLSNINLNPNPNPTLNNSNLIPKTLRPEP